MNTRNAAKFHVRSHIFVCNIRCFWISLLTKKKMNKLDVTLWYRPSHVVILWFDSIINTIEPQHRQTYYTYKHQSCNTNVSIWINIHTRPVRCPLQTAVLHALLGTLWLHCRSNQSQDRARDRNSVSIGSLCIGGRPPDLHACTFWVGVCVLVGMQIADSFGDAINSGWLSKPKRFGTELSRIWLLVGFVVE